MAKKEQEDRDEAEIEETDSNHTEQRVYELGFHIDADLPQEEVKRVYQGLRETIAKVGTVVAEGEPQKIQLAYTVSRMEHAGRRDFDTSFFAWIAYETDGAGHEAVGQAVRATSSVFRHLDIRTNKEAALHCAELQEYFSKQNQSDGETEAEAEVSETELDTALKEAGV